MTLDVELERSIGTTLAAILVAVASFCLSVMALQSNGANTLINDIFGILGLVSMLTSALIIDSILDNAGCTFMYRLKKLMNGGYLLFCLVMAAMSFAILLVYHLQETQIKSLQLSKSYLYLLFGASSVALFLKLMRDEKDNLSAPALVVLYVLSFYFANP
jgi:hypothetical protein